MRKLKLLFAACAIIMGASQAWAQTDVTSTYLTNAGFDDCTAETSDIAAKTIKDYSSNGWTNVNTGSYTTIAVTAYGEGKKVANSTTPSTKKDGTTVSGNTLGIIAGWSDDVKIQSSDITLPAGYYTLTVDHYLSSGTNNYGTSRFGFVTSGTSYIVSSTTFTASAWTTETVSFTLTEETTGKIQIGVKGTNATGSGAPAVFYDDVTITWTDPNLAASKVTLNGYIKKATALNSVLADATLTDAITAAQSDYDTKTTAAEVNNAATALSTAITTALSGKTQVALTNGDFNTTPNNTLNGDGTTTYGGTLSTATSNPDNTKDMTANTGDHAYLYEVTGWTQYSKFNSTASQGTTSEYGTTMPANGWSTNSTTPPATDMLGGKTGAALHLSAGWNDQARYQQTINNLPSGRYVFYYEVINQHSNTGIASNYTGVSGAAGDFYGTTNAFVYSSLSSAAQGEWIAQAFEFDVAKTANINFNVGFTTSTNGSGNGAKLWIDNVLVYRIGDLIVTDADANDIIAKAEALEDVKFNADDKSDLATKLEAFKANKNIDNYNALNASLIQANASKNVYATLNTAIANAESWATTTAVVDLRTKYNNGEYANDVTADDIYAEYQAAEIAALETTGATEFTSVILNQSFETGDMTGWSAESRADTGVKDQNNGTYSITNGDAVDGSKLFNSWGGSAENNVYQTIPNLPAGTYQLSALLAGFTGEELVLAANETTNSVVVAGDKTTGYTVNVIFTLDAVSNVTIKASNTKGASNSDASFIKADNFTLKAYSDPLAALKEQLAALQTDATALLTNDSYSNVTGTERSTLLSLSTTTPEETEAAYNTAISDITAAAAAFTAAKPNYDALVTEIAYAKTIGVTTADDYAATSESTAASVVTNAQNLKTEEFTTVHYYTPNRVTDEMLGTWNKGNYDTTSGQGYISDESYFDKWSGSATDLTSSATVTLPAGKYTVKVAGRGESSTTMNLSVKVGDADAVSTPFLMIGDTGKGIDTDGNTNFDESANYSNDNVGRGWQYRYITFETDGTAEVTIAINGHLNANTWQSFYAPVLLCDDNTHTNVFKAKLQAAIDAAPAVLTANIGTGAFQMPEAGVNAYSDALDAAAAAVAKDNAETSATSINEAWVALVSAINTYKALEINAPADGQLFNVVLTYGGWTYDQKAMTYIAGDRSDMGGYNIKYNAPANENLAQAFTFTKVSGNNYTMSQIDADGNVRYLSTGTAYSGGNTSQIRTTTDESKALAVTVIPTASEGVWNLKNTAANQFIGSQDAGVFTVNSHIDFNIVETQKPSITINTTAAGWGTTILPFAVASLPTDVKAYTCAEVNDALLTLVKVTALEANKPYIIEGSWEETLTGEAQGTALTYTEGLLTGVYEAAPAPAGSYVLQKNKEKVGFYLVEDGQQPTVKANRCYLTVPAGSARAFILFDNETTGIGAIEALTSGEAQIFNINGVQQSGLQKGMNIIRKANGESYKVMVK